MAANFYTAEIDTARLEDFDAQVGPLAATLALVTATGPVRGREAFEQIFAVRQQVAATATRVAREVARLRGTNLADWPGRRPHFVAVAATLGSAGQWLFDLADAEAVARDAALALGWLGQQAGNLGEEGAAAIVEIDAALAALLAEAKAEAAGAMPQEGHAQEAG